MTTLAQRIAELRKFLSEKEPTLFSVDILREETVRYKYRKLRLGSIELYKNVMKCINKSVKNGSFELVYEYRNYLSELDEIQSADIGTRCRCLSEVVHVLKSKGFNVYRDSKYKIMINWYEVMK